MENWLEMMESGDSPHTLSLYCRFYVPPISSIPPGSFSVFWGTSHLLWTRSYETRLVGGQNDASSPLQKWLCAGTGTWNSCRLSKWRGRVGLDERRGRD